MMFLLQPETFNETLQHCEHFKFGVSTPTLKSCLYLACQCCNAHALLFRNFARNVMIQRAPVCDAAEGHRHLNGDSHYVWWDVPEWSRKSKLYTYNHNSGHITVNQRGVYYIYAQV